MAKLLKETIGGFLKGLLSKWIEDFFILAGIAIALVTTYENFGTVIGNYSLSIVLVLIGLALAKK